MPLARARRPLRIAVGGFMHETNTFVDRLTTLADFREENQWPGMRHGEQMLAAVAGRNLAIAGFCEVAARAGHRLLPLTWTMAQPGGRVADDAFEWIAARLLDPLERLAPDCVFIELHGAMASESHDDAEGELLRRMRERVGAQTPILGTLDLHANVSRAMVEQASYLTAFRTYPHVDWGETGRRAARELPAICAGRRRAARLARVPLLIPITAQCTDAEPARGLYGRLAACARETGVALSLCVGFPPADVADCGPAVLGYGDDARTVSATVDGLAHAVEAAEGAFARHRILPAAQAVTQALELAAAGRRPVVIADTEDNPGAGGSSSTTGLVAELMRRGAAGAISAIHHEPQLARAAHAAGVGGELALVLGVSVAGPGQVPLEGRFLVERLSDGRFAGSGPMLAGASVDLGPTALVRERASGVQLVLASHRQPPLSQATFRHLGVEPSERDVIALKSSVHFRNDFEPIAAAILVASSPGANPADPATLPYTKLPPELRRRLRTDAPEADALVV